MKQKQNKDEKKKATIVYEEFAQDVDNEGQVDNDKANYSNLANSHKK